MAKGQIAGIATDGTQIFKATYSNVPVLEMLCKGVAVMRRRSDSWLNATQILKVAGFDKPQRTRVLEREVQKGEHEKVQGGYGKYQGTWIPIERGLALSKQYDVEDLMRPIIDYIPTADSPPQAPKHITAAPSRQPRKSKGDSATPQKAGSVSSAASQTPLSSRQLSRAQHQAQAQAKAEAASALAAEKKERAKRDREEKKAAALAKAQAKADAEAYAARERETTMDLAGSPLSGESSVGSPGAGSSSSRTPSPLLGSDDDGDDGTYREGGSGTKRKFRGGYDPAHSSRRQRPTPKGEDLSMGALPSSEMSGFATGQELLGADRYEDIILDYFISETSQIPPFLVNPPADFNPNHPIDDDGHTALHWACAMGRIRVVKLLLTAGADIFRVNHSEQTALMRSVMFSNNYDVRKFPELYELLHRSTLNIDKNNRTVFHHIADVALSKGKTHAARYYMETILGRLADYPKELGDVVNFQDDEGETALTLAARARSKRLVKSLLDHGADPKLANRDGKTAEDYILEDERFRSSPVIGSYQPGSRLGPSSSSGGGPYSGQMSYTGYINPSTHAGPSNHSQSHSHHHSVSSVHPSGLLPKVYHSQTAQLVAGQTTTELSLLLASLAKSFDAELQAKERDITQANSLANSINLELGETKRQVGVLQSTLGDRLTEGKEKLGQLEAELENRMERRYAAGWNDWRSSHLARERAYLANPSAANPDETIDLVELHAEPVEGGSAEDRGTGLEVERTLLNQEIEMRRKRRKELFSRFVRLQSELGTGPEMEKYAKIIKASAGVRNGEGDVEEIVNGLLQAIEGDAATATVTASLSSPPPPPPSAPRASNDSDRLASQSQSYARGLDDEMQSTEKEKVTRQEGPVNPASIL
ncbi:Transcription regulator HTH, APSES-type DNA-binding domain [Phaffia rhodozyma]|uniref:Transcription regulator HTH, APSES-type DNA-binding domain n=1 Tax=Phaffia rhodozyma TaxID=264483 RepID=A0A0F7SIS1_PHARH|nr:Transcription regulator HTH, APSES-type DNA-binding domain [Phaffia rhodozyma]